MYRLRQNIQSGIEAQMFRGCGRGAGGLVGFGGVAELTVVKQSEPAELAFVRARKPAEDEGHVFDGAFEEMVRVSVLLLVQLEG